MSPPAHVKRQRFAPKFKIPTHSWCPFCSCKCEHAPNDISTPVLRYQDSIQKNPALLFARINDRGFHSCFVGASLRFITIFILFIPLSSSIFYYYLSSLDLFPDAWLKSAITLHDHLLITNGPDYDYANRTCIKTPNDQLFYTYQLNYNPRF